MVSEEELERSKVTLSDAQFKYLVSGYQGEYNEGRLQEDILNDKFYTLGDRIRYLSEDAGLFHSADFIDTTDWMKAWDNIDTSSAQNQLFEGPKGIKNIPKNEYRFYKLGIQLGHIAKLLKEGYDGEIERVETKIVCGFLLGLQGELMSNKNTEIFASREKNITEILSEPPDDVMKYIEFAMDNLPAILSEAPASFEMKLANEALKEVNLETVAPLRKELQEMPEQYYPQELLGENKIMSKSEYATLAEKLQSDERIQKARTLAEKINEDLQTLKERKAGGLDKPITALEILCATSSEKDIDRSDIGDIVEENRTDKPSGQKIRELINYLCGGHGGLPEEYPLINDSGYPEPTGYGKLLSIIITPDAVGRESEEHLPQPDKEEYFIIPSEEKILTACYAFAFGKPNETRKTKFDEAYKERINRNDA